MLIEKNASLIPFYSHEDFLLYTNGIEINYLQFLQSHKEYYQTPIQYRMRELTYPDWPQSPEFNE